MIVKLTHKLKVQRIAVDEDALCSNLKEVASELSGLPVEELKLLYRGRTLSDDMTMKAIGFKDGGKIFVFENEVSSSSKSQGQAQSSEPAPSPSPETEAEAGCATTNGEANTKDPAMEKMNKIQTEITGFEKQVEAGLKDGFGKVNPAGIVHVLTQKLEELDGLSVSDGYCRRIRKGRQLLRSTSDDGGRDGFQLSEPILVEELCVVDSGMPSSEWYRCHLGHCGRILDVPCEHTPAQRPGGGSTVEVVRLRGVCPELGPSVIVEELPNVAKAINLSSNHFDAITIWMDEDKIGSIGAIFDSILHTLKFQGNIYLSMISSCIPKEAPARKSILGICHELQQLLHAAGFKDVNATAWGVKGGRSSEFAFRVGNGSKIDYCISGARPGSAFRPINNSGLQSLASCDRVLDEIELFQGNRVERATLERWARCYESLVHEAEVLGIPQSVIPRIQELSVDNVLYCRNRLRGMIASFSCSGL